MMQWMSTEKTGKADKVLRKGDYYGRTLFYNSRLQHYFGSDFMEKGMKVKLEKEPDNEYDKEAIQVKIKGLGKIGYVANSPFTVKGESKSAGRLYDKIGDKAKGKVVFVVDGGVVCMIVDTGVDKNLNIIDSELQ